MKRRPFLHQPGFLGMSKYELKLTRAMVIEGAVIRAGTKVHLDKNTAKDFLRRGKAELVSEPAGDTDHNGGDQDVDLSRMNKGQLVQVAEGVGVEGAENMTKAEIIAAIESAAQ